VILCYALLFISIITNKIIKYLIYSFKNEKHDLYFSGMGGVLACQKVHIIKTVPICWISMNLETIYATI